MITMNEWILFKPKGQHCQAPGSQQTGPRFVRPQHPVAVGKNPRTSHFHVNKPLIKDRFCFILSKVFKKVKEEEESKTRMTTSVLKTRSEHIKG